MRIEAGVHGEQLDSLEAEFLVPVGHFLLPAVLSGVQREEADECFRMGGDVIGDIAVVNPDAGTPGLAAEDDGLVAGLRTRAIGGIGYG